MVAPEPIDRLQQDRLLDRAHDFRIGLAGGLEAGEDFGLAAIGGLVGEFDQALAHLLGVDAFLMRPVGHRGHDI